MTNDEPPSPSGIPAGMIDAVLAVVRSSPAPIRRRKILEELERKGHRLSLAGLNRILAHCARAHLTAEGPEGVRLAPSGPSRDRGRTG